MAQPGIPPGFEDAPVEPELSLTDRVRKNDDVLEVAQAANADPADVREEADRLYESGYGAEVYTQQRLDEIDAAADQAIADTLTSGGQPEVLAPATRHIMQIADITKALREDTTNPARHEQVMEMAHTGEVTEKSTREYIDLSIATISDRDEQGWMDTAGDIAGLLLWEDFLFEQNELYKVISGAEEGSIGPEALNNFIGAWWAQDEKTRNLQWVNVIEPAIKEVTDDNTHKYRIMASLFKDPTGATGRFEAAMSGGALALTVGPLMLKVAKLARGVNSVSRAKALQSEENAARMIDKALSDETGQAAAEVGIARTDAAMAASPFTNGFAPEAVDNLSGGVQQIAEAIAGATKRIKDEVAPITNDNEWTKLRILTHTEQTKQSAETLKHYKTVYKKQYEQAGHTLDNAEIINQTDDGFQIRFHVRDESGAARTHDTVELSYTTDGILQEGGALKGNKVSNYVFSPSVWMEAALAEGLVSQASLANFQTARLRRVLSRAQKEVWSGQNSASRKRISSVLDAGAVHPNSTASGVEDLGKVYKWDELDHVEVEPGVVIKLTESEKLSYYKARELFDQNYVQLNKVVRDGLVKNGYQESHVGHKSYIMQVPLTRKEAGIKLDDDGFFNVFDGDKGQMVKLTSKEVDDWYASGGRVGKLHDSNYIKVEGNFTTRVLTRDTKVRPLRMNALKYNKGYVPRIYDKSPFVAMKTTKTIVDNVPKNVTAPVRLFASREDAAAWIKTLDETDQADIMVRHKGEVGDKVRKDLITEEAGGLFVDEKGAHLAYGLTKGARAPTINAHDALNKQLGYIASRLPMSELRINLVARWEKAAEQAFKDVGDLAELRRSGFNARLEGIGNAHQRRALEASRRWIRDQLMIPTWEEQKWNRTMVAMADWAEGKGKFGQTAARGIHRYMYDSDPAGFVKGMAFHGMLGVFNPSQLIVQAQGATMALAIDGVHKIPQRLAQYTALRSLLNAPVGAPAPVMTALAKFAGWSSDDLATAVQDFRRSGIFDGVHTNADLDMIRLGMPASQQVWKRALESGLVFYREGESFTRGYSFLVARDKILKAKGLKANHKLTDREMAEVIEESMRNMMNLNRANRAQWQKGVIGVPTQFMQVTTKYIEDVVAPFVGLRKTIGGGKTGNSLTRAEAGKVLLTQLLLYGSAGMVGGEMLLNQGLDWAGVTDQDMDKDTKENLSNGITGILSEAIFGTTAAIGKRGSYISGVEMMWEKIFEDGLTLETLGGAGGYIGVRTWDNSVDLLGALARPAFSDEEYDPTEIMGGLLGMARIFNTVNNGTRAFYWWDNQELIDTKGNAVLTAEQVDNFNSIALLKALSFSSAAEDDVYELMLDNKAKQQVESDVVKMGREMVRDYLNAGNRGELDATQSRNMTVRLEILLKPFKGKKREEMRKKIMKPMFDPDEDRLSQEISKARKRLLNTGVSGPATNTLFMNQGNE